MNQGMIPRELIEEILDRTDIVSLIESYLPLKRQGRNMVNFTRLPNRPLRYFWQG